MKSFYTTIINTCGGERTYSFLPPHGYVMRHLHAITYKGDIYQRLIPSWPLHSDRDRKPNPTKVRALNEAIGNQELVMIIDPIPMYHQEMSLYFKKHKFKHLGGLDVNFKNQ